MSADCPNPLLLGWIKEWLDQARERNSKGVTVYGELASTSIASTDISAATRKLMIP